MKLARRKKANTLSLAIVVLNLCIIAVIVLICILIFVFMTKPPESSDIPTQTTTAATKEGETAQTTTAPEVTTTPASMTKISTTTPVPNTEITDKTTAPVTEASDISAQTDENGDETAQAVDYNEKFFKDDFFIGDSITTGLYLYGKLDESLVFAKTGLNTLTAQTEKIDGKTVQETIADAQPKHTYIMLGANGMAFMGNTYMLNMLKDLLAQIKEAAPDTKIVLLAVSPVTVEYEAANPGITDTIKEYNASLRAMCESEKYTYIDVYNLLLDNDGHFAAKYAEADGLHFKGNTYNALLAYIEKQIG